MKNASLVFLISLAVSVISLNTSVPTAATIVNLYAGADTSVQAQADPACPSPRQKPCQQEAEADDPAEHPGFLQQGFQAAGTLIGRFALTEEKRKAIARFLQWRQLSLHQYSGLFATATPAEGISPEVES